MPEGSETGNRPQGWNPSLHALQQAQQTYLDSMPNVNLTGLTGWLTTQLQHGMNDRDEHCRVYGDALYEISRLIEELRFEASLASVYITEFGSKLCAKRRASRDLRGSFEMPGDAITLLNPSLNNGVVLTQHFDDPITPIAGHRVLAGWYTAQLLDSALARAIAALDCVAVLLWSAARIPPITDRQGRLILPTFCEEDLEVVGSHYCSSPMWLSLFTLTEHSSIQMVRPYRNGFIHQRRAPMELHGGQEVSIRFGGDRAVPPIGAQRQLAIVKDFYSEILHAAITRANEVLSKTSARSEHAGPN
jgi:hypothetical protein